MRRFLLLGLTLPLFAVAAFAQEDDGNTAALTDRLNQLQRDVTFLQKQVYRGAAPNSADGALPGAPVAANQVQISQMQEQIRELRGEIEQVQYQNKQIADNEKKFEADVDYRLQALEKGAAAAAAAPPPAAAPEPAKVEAAVTPVKPAQYTPKDGTAPAATPAPTGKDFPNSNEHYNYAFKLYNAKDYSTAAVSFDEFVHKYPSDPLTANAYFWLGECYYAKTDYTRAADSFRKGYETNQDGQKAPDNLYKLAMSLAAIKRTNEACIVLGQVIDKYGDANPHTKDKAAAARVSLQCK